MNYGILGTGGVARTIGSKLVQNGHRVMLGSRNAAHPEANAWAAEMGGQASVGTFADAARFGEVLFNCTKGEHALAALDLAGAEALGSKLMLDLSNPLDFSKGMPPSLFVCNTQSLAEQIQERFPNLKLVKTLNTLTAALMVNPAKLSGPHDLFVSGNDETARQQTQHLLRTEFGWEHIHDLGALESARGTEMLLPLWIRLWGRLGTAEFNFHIQRG